MIAWLNPAAFAGLAAVILPVLIHLLRQHRAARVPFPSLRFVQPSRSAAVRFRRIRDPWLLLVRAGIIAAAACALAQPVVLTPARLETWNARVARAIVVDTSDSLRLRGADRGAREAADAESVGTASLRRFETRDVRDGVRAATAWLATAPPARREIVVISDWQPGTFTHKEAVGVPASIGLRAIQVGPQTLADRFSGSALFGMERALDVALDGSGTAAAIVPHTRPQEGLRLLAGEGAAGALRTLAAAVTAAGTPAPDVAQPVAVVFAGGTPPQDVRAVEGGWMLTAVLRLMSDAELWSAAAQAAAGPAAAMAAPWTVVMDGGEGRLVRAAASGSELVLHVAAGPDTYLGAAAVRGALRARLGPQPYAEHEILRADARELAGWSRPPAAVGRELAVHAESTDGRWCWAVVLVLLGCESLMRRRQTMTVEEAQAHAA